jgi:hypothetical protein
MINFLTSSVIVQMRCSCVFACRFFHSLTLISHLVLVWCCLQAADKYKDWRQEHIADALMIFIGGTQYKQGTDLWAQDTKGLLAAPDFGKFLSKDRFERILRYWARGPLGIDEKLEEEPWSEVEWWLKGHNDKRKRWLRAGSRVTPDEMMMAWTGYSGPGGIPHLSFVKRKPQPLGAELKAVCDGTTGVCMLVELQEGKERMRRKAFTDEYGATTACTVRMLSNMSLSEKRLETKLKRVVTADSWFASLETAMAHGVHSAREDSHQWFPNRSYEMGSDRETTW